MKIPESFEELFSYATSDLERCRQGAAELHDAFVNIVSERFNDFDMGEVQDRYQFMVTMATFLGMFAAGEMHFLNEAKNDIEHDFGTTPHPFGMFMATLISMGRTVMHFIPDDSFKELESLYVSWEEEMIRMVKLKHADLSGVQPN